MNCPLNKAAYDKVASHVVQAIRSSEPTTVKYIVEPTSREMRI
jgi:hypothetical protein